MSTDDFSTYLRRCREAAGLTQEQLAQLSGVGLRTISDIERNITRYPQRGTLKDLANALGLRGNARREFLQRVPKRPGRRRANKADRAQMPSPPTPLIDREEAIETAATLLQEPHIRLLTLVGPVGVGKTRLGLAIAEAIEHRFPDGVWFVDLSTVQRTSELPSAIAQRLGVQLTGRKRSSEVVASYVRAKRMLLILDNLEQLDAGQHIATLLEHTTKLKIIATSRRALHIRHEQVFEVAPLALPDLDNLPPLADLARIPAIALFVQRARADVPDFQLTESNARDIAAICVGLDGLPLAIELAASRVKIFTPRQMVSRLEPRLDFVGTGDLDLPERQRSLRVAIAWSVELLPRPAKILFHRLAAFPGGATLATLETVCTSAGPRQRATTAASGDDDDEPLLARLTTAELWDALGSLVDASLVRHEQVSEDEIRFTMLQVIREYAQEQLNASGEGEVLRHRQAQWAMALAEQAEPHLFSHESEAWLRRLDQEQANIRAALAWAESVGESEIALRMTGALADYWYLRGQIAQGAECLKRALAIPGGDAPARAKVLVGLALMAMLQGDLRRAEKNAQEARDLADQVGDDFNKACALEYLGSIVQRQRRYAEALDLHQQALSIFNSTRALAWSMTSLCNLAWSALGLGDLDAATAFLDQLLNHVGKTGDPHYQRVGHLIAGDLACAQRDYQAAYAHYEHAFATSQGDRWLAADAIIGFAGIFTEIGHLQRAARLFGAAEALYAEFGVPFPPRNRPAFARWVSVIRTELGDAQSSEEWSTGRAMTDEDVMALLQELASLLQETSIVVSGNGEAPVLCPTSPVPA